MIDEIQIENLALIKQGTLIPARGLTVITGETGAGKTALLSSCKLLMGARAERELIREGESGASVQGRFFFDGPDVVKVVDADAVCRTTTSRSQQISRPSSLEASLQMVARVFGSTDLW